MQHRDGISDLEVSKWQVIGFKDERILQVPGHLIEDKVGLHRNYIKQNCKPEALNICADKQWGCKCKNNQ